MAQHTCKEKGKLFLLNSVTFGDRSEASSNDKSRTSELYTDVLALFSKFYPNIPGFEQQNHYSRGNAHYTESSGKANLDDVSFQRCLSSARSLSTALHKELELDFQRHKFSNDIFSVEDIRASIFYDAHAYIFLAYELTIEYSSDLDVKCLVRSIFKDRKLFKNIGIEELHKINSESLREKIYRVLVNQNIKLDADEINFFEDYTLPALFLPAMDGDSYEFFSNEENRQQLEKNHPLIDNFNDKKMFHVGWNYTIAAGFSTETFVTLLHLITACQAYYFTLLGLKSHYTNELKRVIENSEKLSSFHVKKAEGVQLAFAHTLSSFHEYKSRLYPKYREEVNNILTLWNCEEDVKNIKELIQLDLQSKQRKNSERVERVLFLLAIFQIPSLLSVFTAAKDLIDFSLFLFIESTTALLSLVIFLLILLKGRRLHAWIFLFFSILALLANIIFNSFYG